MKTVKFYDEANRLTVIGTVDTDTDTIGDHDVINGTQEIITHHVVDMQIVNDFSVDVTEKLEKENPKAFENYKDKVLWWAQ